MSTNIASRIGWHTTTVDDDSQDDEARARNDFQGTENKFDLSVSVFEHLITYERPLTSPYPLTPKYWITVKRNSSGMIQAVSLVFATPFQK